jgi:hypothetical protein
MMRKKNGMGPFFQNIGGGVCAKSVGNFYGIGSPGDTARPVSGWTGPKLGCEYVTYYAVDTFTGADNTQLVNHVPDMGSTWIATSPDGTAGAATNHVIQNNEAQILDDAKAAVMDLGVADVWIEVEFTVGSASKAGILFRNSADGNGLSFRVRPADNLMELIQWPLVAISTSVPINWSQGDVKRLAVLAVGDSIKCYVNGVEVIDETTTTYQTNTRHGITSYGSSNDETYDDFTVRQP